VEVNAWLMIALGGVGGFTAAIVWWVLKHLQADIDYGRKSAERGTELAERGASIAEKAS
jgi:hypothetical protein